MAGCQLVDTIFDANSFSLRLIRTAFNKHFSEVIIVFYPNLMLLLTPGNISQYLIPGSEHNLKLNKINKESIYLSIQQVAMRDHLNFLMEGVCTVFYLQECTQHQKS